METCTDAQDTTFALKIGCILCGKWSDEIAITVSGSPVQGFPQGFAVCTPCFLSVIRQGERRERIQRSPNEEQVQGR